MVNAVEREKQIQEEVDKTLQALDNLPKLEANPFLFTRIQARLASQRVSHKPKWLENL